MTAMLAECDTLTTNEVAAVTSVPARQVRHMVEADLLPKEVYIRGPIFKPTATLFVAFNSYVSDVLTASARKTAATELAAHVRSIFPDRGTFNEWSAPADVHVSIGTVTVELTSVVKTLVDALKLLLEAREKVVRDPEILSGTPVLRGTRIPVYDVAASAEKGIPTERILRAYSDLTIRDIELAQIWARAHPPIGRPKRAIAPSNRSDVARKEVARRKANG